MRIGPASLSHNTGFVTFCSSVISSSFGFLYCGRSLAMVDLDLQYPCTFQLNDDGASFSMKRVPPLGYLDSDTLDACIVPSQGLSAVPCLSQASLLFDKCTS